MRFASLSAICRQRWPRETLYKLSATETQQRDSLLRILDVFEKHEESLGAILNSAFPATTSALVARWNAYMLIALELKSAIEDTSSSSSVWLKSQTCKELLSKCSQEQKSWLKFLAMDWTELQMKARATAAKIDREKEAHFDESQLVKVLAQLIAASEHSSSDEKLHDEQEKAERDQTRIERDRTQAELERAMLEREHATTELKRAAFEHEKVALEFAKTSIQREQAMTEREHLAIDLDKMVIEREKLTIEKEKAALEREQVAIQRERAALEREHASAELARASVEREKSTIEREKVATRREALTFEREQITIEREKFLIEAIQLFTQRQKCGLEADQSRFDLELNIGRMYLDTMKKQISVEERANRTEENLAKSIKPPSSIPNEKVVNDMREEQTGGKTEEITGGPAQSTFGWLYSYFKGAMSGAANKMSWRSYPQDDDLQNDENKMEGHLSKQDIQERELEKDEEGKKEDYVGEKALQEFTDNVNSVLLPSSTSSASSTPSKNGSDPEKQGKEVNEEKAKEKDETNEIPSPLLDFQEQVQEEENELETLEQLSQSTQELEPACYNLVSQHKFAEIPSGDVHFSSEMPTEQEESAK